MARSKPTPVDWKTLHGRITAYQKSVYDEDNLRKLFFSILDDGRCDPTPLFNHAFPFIEKAILDGRTQDALEQFAILSIDLCARVDVMAAVMPPLKRMVGHSAKVKDAAPGARKKHIERTNDRYATIRGKVQSMLDSNSRNTLTYAREQVAEERENGDPKGRLLQSLATVKRATRGMKTPQRKKKK